MSKKGVEQKHSETAIFGALHRTIAHKHFGDERFGPDNLAECFLPPQFKFFIKFKKIRANVKNKFDKLLPGLHEYMIARTDWFDRNFIEALRNNIPQIVLLGAGYDSRAYRYAKLNRDTQIFELDIASTQNRKKKCLKKARIDIPEHVTFVPINFNKESLKDVLDQAGYDNRKKTLFLWEGVSYYLDSESVDATLAFLSHSSHNDSALALDYIISISDENIDDYGVKEFFQTMKKHHAKEELMFSIDESKIDSFFKQRGLKIVSRLNNKEIEQKFLLDDKGSLIGQITGAFRFVLASPASQSSEEGES